jgi:hypothetical protein
MHHLDCYTLADLLAPGNEGRATLQPLTFHKHASVAAS